MIPSMIALPISGTVVEMIGQKRTLIIGQILILLGWTVVYFAKQFLILLIGRFLMGLGIGTCLPVTILLNSEIALIKMRGTLSMMGSLAMSIGVIYSLLMAATFPLKHLFILSCVPSLIFLMLSAFLPESPVWLMRKGYKDSARKVLMTLRGNRYDINPEIKELENLVAVSNHENSKWIEKLEELKSRHNVFPFMIMVVILMIQVDSQF